MHIRPATTLKAAAVHGPRTAWSLTWAIALCAALAGCGDTPDGAASDVQADRELVPAPQPDSQAHSGAAAQATPLPTDVDPWQIELLELAFGVASSIPETPHLRDKAKAQEWCATAALALDQVDVATRYAESMKTWRQATMLADIGGWYASRGDHAEMTRFAERALSLAPLARDWQRDRIRVHAARAYAKGGEDARAKALAAGVGEADMGKVELAVAERGTGAAGADGGDAASNFDVQLAQVDEWIMTLNFDLTRNAAEICIALYATCQDDPERCARIERSIAAANRTLPPDIRISNLLALARVASAQVQMDRSAALVESAEGILNAGNWMPQDEIVQVAAIAIGKHAIGRSDAARHDLANALNLFGERREEILDIDRATPLRAVAVTQALMGDRADAHQTFLRALDEGTGNPNARPRAEDLTETCVAMVRHGVNPGDEGWARIRTIRGGLADPW
jgi:hypothetical protein